MTIGYIPKYDESGTLTSRELSGAYSCDPNENSGWIRAWPVSPTE